MEFVIARNPDPDSRLPYLIRLPLGPDGIVLKARETWPRTAKVFCHPSVDWPSDPDVVERVPVRSCQRRGAAIDLVLDRARENRSQLVFTQIHGGRQAIFWQSARTAKQARPNVGVPTRRSAAGALEILVDSRETYAWKFSQQQATTSRRALSAGDYAVEAGGAVVAAVERKSLADLVATLTSGKIRYVLADLAALPRAAIVVEDRYSAVFRYARVRPGVIAEALAEAQARVPSVPIVFCETRQLAEEWTYRYLGACLHELETHGPAELRAVELRPAGPLPAPQATTADIRQWAIATGLAVADRGRLPPHVREAYLLATAQAAGPPPPA